VASDEELMVQVQTGSDAALETLISRWRAPLFGFLHRRTDAASADDLFQETWIRVARARHSYDPTRRFSTWMFQIANNLARDRHRRRQAAERARARLGAEAGVASHSPAEAADLRLDMTERLARLPDRQREVLVLRYWRQLGEADIAEALGIPRGTVKSRLHAAVRALREQLAEEESA
jgi:RNA polymerase sigma-70 factor (ECF subfamily)